MNATDPISDERILREAVLRGDDAAWRVLYERYVDAIHAFVHWRARLAPERAEEITQECWMIAVRTMRRFDPARCTFGTWLRGIANNLLRNETRASGRAPFVSLDQATGVAAPATDPAGVGDGVAAVMQALPDDYRLVLTAKYRDGLAVAEIAADSGRSPKAVESLLTRARDAFRRAWASSEKPR